ncbi:MAG TPA: biotin/lipoate A/B protein ligase family protein [Candidatus Dormibacteraeota bacterium]|nr:biotin/lipoate A/B protein ligase family protein [Candidatus Dormibacteraeota bacterium]
MLLDRLVAGRRGPTLRFWEWAEAALVLGSHQVIANEVDLDEAKTLGFIVARRMSGGGTMIVEPGRTITYSLYAPESLIAGLSFVDSFARLDAWAVECLRGLGVPASYRPINDIVSPEGKIGGAAQARRRGQVLHHTAIAHTMDTSIVPRLIRIGRDRVSPRGVRSAEKTVSPLDRWLWIDRDAVVAAMVACFRAGFDASPGELASDELADARTLAAAKYATAEWVDRVR